MTVPVAEDLHIMVVDTIRSASAGNVPHGQMQMKGRLPGLPDMNSSHAKDCECNPGDSAASEK